MRLRRERRRKFDSELFRGIDHSAEITTHALPPRDDLVAMIPSLTLKFLDRRRPAEHRIRLMADLPNCDANDDHLSLLCGPDSLIS